MTTRADDPAAEVALYLRGLYEIQRDDDRLPETTDLLYGFDPDARYCRICLRRYELMAREDEGGRGGPPQLYCGPTCRARATDRRRRELPWEWRWCASCGGPFLARTLDSAIGSGRVVCPQPWPAPPFVGPARPSAGMTWLQVLSVRLIWLWPSVPMTTRGVTPWTSRGARRIRAE
jgi:hypothetical protein